MSYLSSRGRYHPNQERKVVISELANFVSEYAEFLDKKTEEYRKVSEMAIAMAVAVNKVSETK